MSDDAQRLPERAEALLAGATPAGVDWDAQAQAIERRLQSIAEGSTESKLLDAPTLVAEPGEPLTSSPRSAPPPPSSSPQLLDLARAVAQKSKGSDSNALYKQSLSVAAAARAQSPTVGRPRSQPPLSSPSQPPAQSSPSQLSAQSAAALAPGVPPERPNPRALASTTRSLVLAFVAGAALATATLATFLWVMPPRVQEQDLPAQAAPREPTAEVPNRSGRQAAETVESQPGTGQQAVALDSAEPGATPEKSGGEPPVAGGPTDPGPSADKPIGHGKTAGAVAPPAPARPSTPLRAILEESAKPKGAPLASEPGLRIASGVSNTVPERPSAGAVQAALGSVLRAARACVSGDSAPSSASVVFVSSGSVARVTVSGKAAGKPAAGCIQSALGRAKIAPFAKPTYVVNGIAIRP